MFGQALKRAVIAAGAVGAMFVGLAASPASAGVIINAPFTWFPGGSIPPLAGQPAFTADNITVKDFSKITVQNGGINNGTFVEDGILQITAFSCCGGGGVISTPGLNGTPSGPTNYKLYFTFHATGDLNGGLPWPTTGVGAGTAGKTFNGTFASLSYSFFGDPSGTSSLGNVLGVPTVIPGGGPPDVLLGSGVLFDTCPICTNSVSLGFNKSNLPLPAAQASETFVNALGQAGFFLAPVISLDLEDAFTNTGVGQVALLPGCIPTPPATSCNSVLITNGGGSADFFAITVPEPGSLLLLGTGLVGWAGASRRRRSRS